MIFFYWLIAKNKDLTLYSSILLSLRCNFKEIRFLNWDKAEESNKASLSLKIQFVVSSSKFESYLYEINALSKYSTYLSSIPVVLIPIFLNIHFYFIIEECV